MKVLNDHPTNPANHLWGTRLRPGDVIGDDDYTPDLAAGLWTKAPNPGHVIRKNCPTVYVRIGRRELHQHPADPFQQIWGVRLRPGESVEKGDYFAGPNGWEEFTSLGHVILKTDKTYWVRMC